MTETLTKTRILFVDDEKQILDGLNRMLHSFKKEWDLFFATSGTEALEFLEKNHVNIIISDMRMPGMNGAELLNRVQKKYPEIIRIILSGYSDEELVLKSIKVAHQFLNKPCSPQDLVETIKRTVSLKNILENEAMQKTINGIEELPTAPEQYLRLENELSQPNVSLSKVSNIVSEDIGLSAKILQLVNSAFFGLPTHVANIDSAVNLLGINTVKSLVLFMDLVHNKNAAFANSFPLDELFHHSLRVATASQNIYKYECGNSPIAKEAYAAGLLHDVGKLVLLKYPGYIQKFRNNSISGFYQKEYELLGVSHAEVGAYLLGVWNLPNHIVEAVAFHHDSKFMTTFNLATAVFFANILVKENDVNESGNDTLPFKDKISKWQAVINNV